jgi:hypothetical protein
MNCFYHTQGGYICNNKKILEKMEDIGYKCKWVSYINYDSITDKKKCAEKLKNICKNKNCDKTFVFTNNTCIIGDKCKKDKIGSLADKKFIYYKLKKNSEDKKEDIEQKKGNKKEENEKLGYCINSGTKQCIDRYSKERCFSDFKKNIKYKEKKYDNSVEKNEIWKENDTCDNYISRLGCPEEFQFRGKEKFIDICFKNEDCKNSNELCKIEDKRYIPFKEITKY